MYVLKHIMSWNVIQQTLTQHCTNEITMMIKYNKKKSKATQLYRLHKKNNSYISHPDRTPVFCVYVCVRR